MADLIDGYTNHTITRDGVVINTKTGTVKKPWLGKNGYWHVDLHEHGKARKVALHRLLAIQYIPNPDNKRTVNHKDGIKTNNSIENLEWATDSENIAHAHCSGLNKGSGKHSKTFYENLVPKVLAGATLQSLLDEVDVSHGQLSVHLRSAALRLGLQEQYRMALRKQRRTAQQVSIRERYSVAMLHPETKEELKRFPSLSSAGQYLGKKTAGPISNVLHGRQKTAYGYFWVKV